jgi:hypothetical protein
LDEIECPIELGNGVPSVFVTPKGGGQACENENSAQYTEGRVDACVLWVSCHEPTQGRRKERVHTRTIGAGEGELVAEVAEAEADVAEGERVRVTLKVVGTTV